MQTLPRLIAISLLTTLLAFEAGAEERNGLLVNISKRTLNRADRRDSVYYTQYDRTQGYKVTIKNTSLKALPEGEVNWTILVVKPSYGTSEKYVGTEKLKPLRPSESAELMFGAVPIGGYRLDRDYKDEMEHEIVISHGGKETLRSTSKPSFAALAKRATLVATEPEEGEATPEPGAAAAMRRRATPGTPAVPATPGQPATPATPGTPAVPATAGTTPMPAVPGTPAPAAPGTTPPATAPTPATQPPAVIPPPESQQPFDFFNLKKKPSAPEAK